MHLPVLTQDLESYLSYVASALRVLDHLIEDSSASSARTLWSKSSCCHLSVCIRPSRTWKASRSHCNLIASVELGCCLLYPRRPQFLFSWDCGCDLGSILFAFNQCVLNLRIMPCSTTQGSPRRDLWRVSRFFSKSSDRFFSFIFLKPETIAKI